MFATLPAPDLTDQPRIAPQLVVWQLQFADVADVASTDIGSALATTLGERLGARPQLTRVAPPVFTVAVGQNAMPALGGDETPNGWQIRIAELVVTVDRSFLAVETANYESWERFHVAVRETLATFVERIANPPGEQRLGLRYVDRFSPAQVHAVTEWEGWLQPWLLGSTTQPQLAPATVAFAQQIDWEDDDGARATIRQRAFADVERRGRPTMLLDFDVFREGYRPFDRDDVLAATDELNDVSIRLFRASITDRLYDSLREEPSVT